MPKVSDPTRHTLPISDREFGGMLPFDAKDPAASFPPIEPLQPPTGAPNVLVVLLDDVGFAASSAFGGPCHTPTAERLAAAGLKYNRFHTTALCAPTRAALLTGRNHHTVGMGVITELATSAPGYSSVRPNTCAQRFIIDGDKPIPAGTHQGRMQFEYDGGGLAKGGTVTLYLDGAKVGEGRVDAAIPMVFSADETADVGRDTVSPVSTDHNGESSVFTGTVAWVQIDLGDDADDADHLITPEERLRVSMARQ